MYDPSYFCACGMMSGHLSQCPVQAYSRGFDDGYEGRPYNNPYPRGSLTEPLPEAAAAYLCGYDEGEGGRR